MEGIHIGELSNLGPNENWYRDTQPKVARKDSLRKSRSCSSVGFFAEKKLVDKPKNPSLYDEVVQPLFAFQSLDEVETVEVVSELQLLRDQHATDLLEVFKSKRKFQQVFWFLEHHKIQSLLLFVLDALRFSAHFKSLWYQVYNQFIACGAPFELNLDSLQKVNVCVTLYFVL